MLLLHVRKIPFHSRFSIAEEPLWTNVGSSPSTAAKAFKQSNHTSTFTAATSRIAVFVVLQNESQISDYELAINTLRCYAKGRPEYEFVLLFTSHPNGKCPQKEVRERSDRRNRRCSKTRAVQRKLRVCSTLICFSLCSDDIA